MEKLSIIIVNYKTAELTIECIKSIYDSGLSYDFEIILIDNNSQDRSAEEFGALPDDVETIMLNENIGFAAANNLGAKRATGSHILFLNPDTVVLPGAIDALVRFAERRPGAGAWGGRTVFGDGTLNPTSVSGFITLYSLFLRVLGFSSLFKRSAICNPDVYPAWQRDTERSVDVLFFCFVLVRVDVWRDLGGFDERFFMFCEDDDICWRMEMMGLERWFTPDACIIHYGSASIPHRPDRIVMVLKARLTWITLHWSRLRAWTARHIIRASVLGRMIVEQVPVLSSGNKKVWSEVWAKREEWSGS